MNKKIYLFGLISGLVILVSSCLKTDDTSIDETWKSYNDNVFKTTAADPTYTQLNSLSGNGAIYYKPSDFIAKSTSASTSSKITDNGTPYITDSVVIRYEASYQKTDGTEFVFDGTEGVFNSQGGRGCRLNGTTLLNGFIVNDGLSTMIQNMVVGEQQEVVVPYILGYGVNQQSFKLSTGGTVYIPGYTTLRYKIKLLKIIPDNPGEF